jgi:hypothetical protein
LPVLQVAYYDEQSGSAIRRVMDPMFTVSVTPQTIPATPDQEPFQIDHESKTPVLPVAVPALRNFVVEQGRPKPVPPDPVAVVLLEVEPSCGSAQRPSTSGNMIAVTLDSATESDEDVTTEADEVIAPRRIQSKGRGRIPPRSLSPFGSRIRRRRSR